MDGHDHPEAAIITQNPNLQFHGHPKKKKKTRSFPAMHIIRVALYFFKSGKFKHDKNHQTASIWKRLLGSMRLLHHLPCTNNSPPSFAGPEPEKHEVGEPLEVFTPPLSPGKGGRTSPSSRYASAVNLQELDDNGDEMIDEKADLFIAKFYEEIRLQHEA